MHYAERVHQKLKGNGVPKTAPPGLACRKVMEHQHQSVAQRGEVATLVIIRPPLQIAEQGLRKRAQVRGRARTQLGMSRKGTNCREWMQ